MANRGSYANTVIPPHAAQQPPAVQRRAGSGRVNLQAELELICQSFEAITLRLRNVEQWIHACGEGKIALPPDAGHEARLALLEAKQGSGKAARK